jgi:hypothetical protein
MHAQGSVSCRATTKSIHSSTALRCALAAFQFLNPYIVGMTPQIGHQPVARALPTYRTTQTQNKRTQTFMPRLRFEPTTQVFEPAKTIHELDHAATVIGRLLNSFINGSTALCWALVSPSIL